MTNRENALAVLNYENYYRMPVVHFGYWNETLEKWVNEGHISQEKAVCHWTGNPDLISADLGFDFGWYPTVIPATGLNPAFEWELIEEMEDGSKKLKNHYPVS